MKAFREILTTKWFLVLTAVGAVVADAFVWFLTWRVQELKVLEGVSQVNDPTGEALRNLLFLEKVQDWLIIGATILNVVFVLCAILFILKSRSKSE